MNCPVCAGWGVTPPFSTTQCINCGGAGIRILDGNNILYTKIPGFIDFRTRKIIKLSKVGLIATLLGMLLLAFYIVISNY